MSPRADLVLAGGGVKGIGHVGALSAFFDAGYTFERVAGTSAGAIVGAFVAAGMPPDRMLEVMRDVDYRTFRDRGGVDRVPLAGPALSLLFEDGIYEGDAVHDWVERQLRELGVETFADLRLPRDRGTALPPAQRYRLVVMTADVDRGELIRLPWDYERYGLDPDEQRVADAVRASMSIPFFYEPVELRHGDGTSSTLVDGGVLTNFPIDTFDRVDLEPPRWPTFGITLLPKLPAGNARVLPGLGVVRHGPLHLLEQLVTTMLVGHDQAELAKPWVAARTIAVDTDAVGAVDFDLDRAAQELLFANGRDAAERFLAGWDFEAYKARFRPPPLTP